MLRSPIHCLIPSYCACSGHRMRLGAARMAHAGFLSVTVTARCGLLILVANSNLLYVPLARRFLSFDADVHDPSQWRRCGTNCVYV